MVGVGFQPMPFLWQTNAIGWNPTAIKEQTRCAG